MAVAKSKVVAAPFATERFADTEAGTSALLSVENASVVRRNDAVVSA